MNYWQYLSMFVCYFKKTNFYSMITRHIFKSKYFILKKTSLRCKPLQTPVQPRSSQLSLQDAFWSKQSEKRSEKQYIF